MATYLVTGGLGFIGSHLAATLLDQGHQVRILDDLSSGHRKNAPSGADIVIGDVANETIVKTSMKNVDGCFHLAAVASVQRSNEAWLETHKANLTGTICILDEARRANPRGPVPVVYASSAAVYGDNSAVPLAEDAAIRPLSAYGADKYGSELHAYVATNVHHVPTRGFRFFNVYGPRQDPKSPYSGVIAIFAEKLVKKEPITIFGDGTQSRDFIFVADVVRHLIAGMNHALTATDSGAESDVFNVCTGTATTVLELAHLIADILDVPANIKHGPARSGDIYVSYGNPAKATTALGVKAQVSLRDGLSETLAWIAEQ